MLDDMIMMLLTRLQCTMGLGRNGLACLNLLSRQGLEPTQLMLIIALHCRMQHTLLCNYTYVVSLFAYHDHKWAVHGCTFLPPEV